MYRLANIQKFNISSIKQCLNAISKKYLSDPINAMLIETSNNDKTLTNDDVARYIFNYEQINDIEEEQVADSTKITKQLLTYATDNFGLDYFDGDNYIEFTLVDCNPYKQTITLAIDSLGKIVVTDKEVRIDKNDRIYFEHGNNANIQKVYLEDFWYEN